MHQTINVMTIEQIKRLSMLMDDKGWNPDLLKAFARKCFDTEDIFNLSPGQAEILIAFAEEGPEFYLVKH